MRTLAAALATALLAAGTGTAFAQLEVLTPEMVATLEPAKEKPLTLAPSGDVARFLSGDEDWQEAAPPLILDINRDGVRDFVVLSLVDVRTLRRALIIHDWGDAPSAFGSAVFYLVLDADDDVVEWGGKHQLLPRPSSEGRNVSAP